MDDTSPRDASAAPYRVLARKYRPRTFKDLIGQDPMVRTLKNAFETGRIPQAWMLTGVRGVGKTTTAAATAVCAATITNAATTAAVRKNCRLKTRIPTGEQGFG